MRCFLRNRTGLKLDFTKEQQVGNIKHKFGGEETSASFTGRLDAIINNLVIEYKHYSKLKTEKQFNSAVRQIEEYLSALLDEENKKYSAVLTDGVRISYFDFIGEKIRHTNLTQISNNDIDIIMRAVIFNSTKRFVPANIMKDFSTNAGNASISKKLALCLYSILKNKSTDKTKMLFEEWKRLMHLSVDDSGKSNDIEKRRKELSLIFFDDVCDAEIEYLTLYALQTTYAILVKLIACKVIDKVDYNDKTNNFRDFTTATSKDLQNFFEKMEDGYSYRSSNVINFLEGDFFSWYSDKVQWTPELWEITIEIINLIDKYSAFSFNIVYAPIDIFKDLYMSVIPRSVRHSMGEYFTPQWLADCVVTNGIKNLFS